MNDFKNGKNEEIESTLRLWKEIVKEYAHANLSNYTETILLYICALTGKVNDDFFEFINIFAYPKYTKEEIEGVIRIINSNGTNMNYITPSFFFRMMNNDISKIFNSIVPNISISENKEMQISGNSNQEEYDEISLETFNAILILTEAVAIGFKINLLASPKSKTFISNFKTIINGLLETNDFLFAKEDRKYILKLLNEIDFDKHDNKVYITDDVMSEIENKFKNYIGLLLHNNYLKWYIQVNLVCLWSSNENLNKEMIRFFNFFREYQYSKEQILAVMKIMNEADYSSLLPFDFMHFIYQDLCSGTCETRYYISVLQKIFIYGVYLNNALSLEAINIIEKAISGLKKLCNDNNVIKDDIAKQLDESSSRLFIGLYNEIKESEKNINNGIFEERKNIVKENVDDLFFNIVDYILEIGCITEKDAQKYLSMPILVKDEIEVLKKIFKKNLKYVDFDMKIKLIKYVQKYVKRFYNESKDSNRQSFIEKVLNELLKQVSFYDSNYVKKIKCNSLSRNKGKIEYPEIIIYQGKQYICVGNIEHSLIKDKLIVKDLFSYPTRKLDKLYKNKILCKDMLLLASTILEQTIVANQISLADELIRLLNDSNSDYCKEVIDSLIKFLEDNEINLTSSQLGVLLQWTNSKKYVNFYVKIIENNIKTNKLNCTDEIFELLYSYSSNFFNEIFNLLILIIKDKGKYLSGQQIDLLSKWIKHTSKEKFNNFAISSKTKYLNEVQTNYIQDLITDIVKNENDIINCLKVISDKDQIYFIIKSIIKSVDEEKNENIKCLFRIINNTSIRQNLTYYKFLNDDSSINRLIDVVEESTKADYNALSVFLLIFDTFSIKRNINKVIELTKKLIDNKPIFANQIIKKIILGLGNKKIPKYIEQIVKYANLQKIDNSVEKEQNNISYRDLYNQLSKTNELKKNENIDLGNYILNVDSIMLDEEICIIDEKVRKMFKHRIKEDEFDFERVIEHIIKNKDFFLHDKTVDKFNYAEWFFEGIEKIASEEKLKKLIENQIIINDIYDNLEEYDEYYFDLKYKNYYGKINLKSYLIEILIMKYYNNEVTNIVLHFAQKIENEHENYEFFKEKNLIEQCYNDANYSTLESIERLHNNLINELKDPIFDYEYLLCCSFHYTNSIYLLFIVKTCEKNYEFVTEVLHKYLTEENDYEAVDVIIYEVYKEYGINMIKRITYFDDNFKKLYFQKVHHKIKLITKVSDYMSKNDAIIMLDFLINNIDDENNKYELIKGLLSSTNYRKIISLQEIEYINSIIITLNNEKYKKELLHKCELLAKKRLKQN